MARLPLTKSNLWLNLLLTISHIVGNVLRWVDRKVGWLHKFLLALSLTALMPVMAMPVQGEAFDSVFMVTGSLTSQPIGHYEFCQRYNAECAVRTRRPTSLRLTQEKWNKILTVNFSVNARIEPATDSEIYGREEYWEYPIDFGDCEDYVLQKRRELHEFGLPLSNLLVTVVRKPDGEGHAVLTIKTDRGDFILDNLRDEVLNWSDTEYIYLKRQSEHHSGRWLTIEPPADLLVGSVRGK